MRDGQEKPIPIHRNKLFVSSVAVAILILLIISPYFLFKSKERDPSFQIIAFAGDSLDKNQLEERLIKADISMVMPNGQIVLNLGDALEPGSYGWGTGSFYVTGKDIARVTYSLKYGMMQHYDKAMEYKQNLEGNPIKIEFFLPYSALDLDQSKITGDEPENKYLDRLKTLWNSGKCPDIEAVKKGYFTGKSLDIEDYSIMSFVGTWKDAQTNGRYFRFIDRALDEKLNTEAHKLTVEYYHFDYGKEFNFNDSIYSVTWTPTFKPNLMLSVKSPEELPEDEMIVNIELKNGEVIRKVIRLSFNKDGYVVAKIK